MTTQKRIIKTMILSMSLSLSLACMIQISHASIGLKRNSIVTDNTIKLGDVFYGLERNEDRILGTAPRPGEELTINARTLLRIALALDLSWRPSSNGDFVTIHRDATMISYDQIQETLKAAVQNDGMVGNFEISVPQDFKEIILPSHVPSNIEVTSIRTDKNAGRFTANVVAPSKDNPVYDTQIIGYIHPVVRVPVLKDNLQNGSIIRPSDLHFVNIREREFSKDTMIDPKQIIGMTARRYIMSGRPIRDMDVIAPQIISRGQLATLSLNSGAMNITTQVKALENGAKGDVIRVVNLTSNQTLQAVITGDNALEVIGN